MISFSRLFMDSADTNHELFKLSATLGAGIATGALAHHLYDLKKKEKDNELRKKHNIPEKEIDDDVTDYRYIAPIDFMQASYT